MISITDPNMVPFMAKCPFPWQGSQGGQNWINDLYNWGHNDGAGSGAAAPAPTLTSLTPSSIAHGSAAFTLIVRGTNFQTGAVVVWAATNLTTTINSPTQLSASVPATLVATAGTASITVKNPDTKVSGALTFTIS